MKLDPRANRQELFPAITDWTDPQDHLRFETNVKGQSFSEWYYMSPANYKIQKIGVPSLLAAFFGLGAYTCFIYDWVIPTLVLLPIFLLNIYQLYKVFKDWKNIKTRNFYDDLMRDY